MSDLLNKNLDNIEVDYDLFGNKIEKLSMRDRIGFLPISIWQPDWAIVKQLKEIVGDIGENRQNSGNYGFLAKGSTSIFNPHLAQMILSAYCPVNAKIYDPFAGGGTRGFIATAMGYKYTGVEIRTEEVLRIVAQQKTLGTYFDIFCKDSRSFIQRNHFDFSYTCPPYYDLEIYSELGGDLSAAKTYNDFLAMLRQIVNCVYNSLVPGALSIWVVGNFRDKQGKLKHFNGDLIRMGIKIGFDLHDELIFWGASTCAAQRCGQFKANRKSVRVHEYIVVFKKPERY